MAPSLNRLSWLGRETTSSSPSLTPSQPQPLPKWLTVVLVSSSLNAAKLPNLALIAAPRLPPASPLVGHWRLLLTGRAPLDLLLAQVLRQDAAFGLALALPRLVLVGLGVKLLATGAGDAAR